ncbi:MAG: plastocyanin/azurin family copper-binding protein [Actinomycetota bacterium]
MVRTLRLVVAFAIALGVPGAVTSARAWAGGPGSAAVVSSPTGSDTTTHQILTDNYTYVPGDTHIAPLPPLQIVEGDSLVHTNLDGDLHNLESLEHRPDGQPWFISDLVGVSQSAPVPVEQVPPGLYTFICTIHPYMTGSLQILPRPAPVPESGGDIEVNAGDNFFAPKDLTVPAGTTVEWRNTGQVAHSVTASDGSWDSSPQCPTAAQVCWQPGETYSHTFLKPGVYLYYCKVHGTAGGGGHAGVVRVLAPGSSSTSVPSLNATASGSQVSVSGGAVFAGESPVSLAQDPAGDAPGTAQTAQDTGVDLVGASAYQPDPAIPSVFFEWHVTGLPESGSFPEAVRYTIPFRTGGKQFQVQAKLSDLSATDRSDPQGRVGNTGHAFELRECIDTTVPPAGTCTHMAWLTGSFDVATNTIRVKVPLGATPEIVPGAVLTRNQSPAGDLSTIQTGYQIAPGAETVTADQAAWGGSDTSFTYRIPDRQVSIGIAPAGTPLGQVMFAVTTTADSTGRFAGVLSAPGPGSWDVWARACFGANCATRVTTIQV